MRHRIPCGICVVFGIVSLIALADGAEPQEKISFETTKVDAEELVHATGLDIHKFVVDMPKGQKFRILLVTVEGEGKPPRGLFVYPFQKTSDEPTTMLVTFLRTDGKLGSVLLSQEEWAEFKLDCSGCDQTGIATRVRVPLADVHSKTVIWHRSSQDAASVVWHRSGQDAASSVFKETRLLTIVPSESGKPVPSLNSYPRAELIIECEP